MNRLISQKEVLFSIIGVIFGVIVISLSIWLAGKLDLEFYILSKDIISTYKASPFTGLFSNAGIILWGIITVTLFITWYYGILYLPKTKETRVTLLLAIITGIMYLDDFLMIHEIFVPYYLKLNEMTMPAIYFVSIGLIIFFYFNTLKRKGLLMLVLGYGSLGISAVLDTLFYQIHIPQEYIFEDGFKFIGIVLWTLFALYWSTGMINSQKEV